MRKYGSHKEIADILRSLENQPDGKNWRVEKTSSSHWRCYAPDGKTIVTCAGTPGSGYRAVANFKAALRRAGAKI